MNLRSSRSKPRNFFKMELYDMCYLDVWEEGGDFHLKLRGM